MFVSVTAKHIYHRIILYISTYCKFGTAFGYLNYLNPDIFYINLYHVTAMATLFSGFTLALLLAFAKREGQIANLFLSAALAVIVLKTGGL
jgi:hypothetical protein